MDNVRFLIIMAYTVVKLPFALRMIKAAFYAIDEELEDAAKNLGASPLVTFLRVKLPIVLPSVLAVFALNFNALFTEYDMGATFAKPEGRTYAMVIQSMCAEEGRDNMNMNASGRRCAATVVLGLLLGLAGIAAFAAVCVLLVGLMNAGTLATSVDMVALLFLLSCLGVALSIAGTILSNRGRHNPKGRVIGILGMIISILGITLCAAVVTVTLLLLTDSTGAFTEAFQLAATSLH